MKKIITTILLILMLSSIILTSASCSLIKGTGNDKTDNGGNDEGKNEITQSKAQSFVSLDINPEITLTLDENGAVLTVVGENEDANVLLFGEDTLVGMNIEAAVEKITALATELGYLSEENGAVTVLADGCESSEKLNELVSKISAKITATAQNSGLSVTVDTEGAYSLLRQYEAFKAENPELAESVSVTKFKMALTARENGDITLEGALELDDSELIARISKAHENVKAYYTEVYEERRAEAMRIYELALETEVDKVYVEYLTANGKGMSFEMLYAYVYQMYAITARGLNAAADTIEFFDTARNYELDEAKVAAIAADLDLSEDEIDKLKNEDGKVTLDSVLDYVDVYMKNAGADVDKEAIKAAIDESIASAEADVIAEANRLAEEYKPQIQVVINNAELIKSTYDSMLALISPILPPEVKDELTGLVKDYEAAMLLLAELLEGGTPTTDALREVALDLGESADETLAKLEALLSEEAKADIEARKQAKREAREAERAAFEEAIAKARKDAEDRLAALKAAREAE